MKLTKAKLYTLIAILSAIIISIGAFVTVTIYNNESHTDDLTSEATIELITEEITEESTEDPNIASESVVISGNTASEPANSSDTASADLSLSPGQSGRTAAIAAADSASSTEKSTMATSETYSQSSSSSSTVQSQQWSTQYQSSQGTNNSTSAPTTSTPMSPDTSLPLKEQVLQLTNQIRSEVDASTLVLDTQLSAIADIRAKEIVESFSHTRPDGSQFYTAYNENGYTYTSSGENIAYGYSTSTSVVTAWKNSSGHYKNMISTNFSRLGVGLYISNGTYYWVQLFSN